jgi:hypothetical protein
LLRKKQRNDYSKVGYGGMEKVKIKRQNAKEKVRKERKQFLPSPKTCSLDLLRPRLHVSFFEKLLY